MMKEWGCSWGEWLDGECYKNNFEQLNFCKNLDVHAFYAFMSVVVLQPTAFLI